MDWPAAASAPEQDGRAAPGHRATFGRSLRLFGAFRREGTDPEYFYGLMAQDTVAQLGTYTRLTGKSSSSPVMSPLRRRPWLARRTRCRPCGYIPDRNEYIASLLYGYVV